MTVGVYVITHRPSGREYIGSSVEVEKRWLRHRQDLNKNDHHSPYLQRCWTKYGEAEFDFAVLEETTREAIRRTERRLIRERQPAFNCMSATKDGPLKHSKATREKMSAAQRRIWEERRANGTDKLSEGHKARIAASATGRKHTDESKAKMSKAAKNRKSISDETRAKLSAAGKKQKGRKFTDEHRAKLSAAHRGRKLSAEQKQRISEGLKKAYADGKR